MACSGFFVGLNCSSPNLGMLLSVSFRSFLPHLKTPSPLLGSQPGRLDQGIAGSCFHLLLRLFLALLKCPAGTASNSLPPAASFGPAASMICYSRLRSGLAHTGRGLGRRDQHLDHIHHPRANHSPLRIVLMVNETFQYFLVFRRNHSYF